MKATFSTENGNLRIETNEHDSVKDLFSELAAIQEVFDADSACGACGCQRIRFIVRRVDDYTFFELRCTGQGCYARLEFGQAKKGGGLFPKRKDEDGNWLPNRGWTKYQKNGQQAQAEPVAAGRPAGGPPPFRDTITDDDLPF